MADIRCLEYSLTCIPRATAKGGNKFQVLGSFTKKEFKLFLWSSMEKSRDRSRTLLRPEWPWCKISEKRGNFQTLARTVQLEANYILIGDIQKRAGEASSMFILQQTESRWRSQAMLNGKIPGLSGRLRRKWKHPTDDSNPNMD